jgi:hypothetical protein
VVSPREARDSEENISKSEESVNVELVDEDEEEGEEDEEAEETEETARNVISGAIVIIDRTNVRVVRKLKALK